MEYIRLTKAYEKESGIHIMVLGCIEMTLNANEYYLINESTIRKEISSCIEPEPELIILIDTNNTFNGLFKRSHIDDTDMSSPVCWNKVY